MMNSSLPKIPNIKVLSLILGVAENDLNEVLKDIDKYYYRDEKPKLDEKGFPVFDKNGKAKVRVLFPSTGLLKKIQGRVRIRILTTMRLPKNIKGGVKGEDNIKNARYHVGNKYKFATDLKDFFPSISESVVFKMFRWLGYYPKVADALTKLVTYQGAVPQGAPTSTDIANLVFLPIDYEIITFCQERKIKYSRFVDDLSFSAAFDFKEESFFLVRMISPHFRISRKKTFFTSGKAKFTGLWVGVSSLNVDDAFYQKMIDDSIQQKEQITPRRRYYKRVRNAMKNANKALKNTPH